MTTTNPATQSRLKALLVGAIYAIVDALFPLINTIAQKPDRPWHQRASFATRFSRILQDLLALTARIRPDALTRNPTFPPLPDRSAQPPKTATPKQPGPLRPIRPAPLLSARQFAQRLEALLQKLIELAAEIGAALPQTILRNIERARAITGCDTLPPTTWERAG